MNDERWTRLDYPSAWSAHPSSFIVHRGLVIDPVALTRELISIPSPTGREHAVTVFLAEHLRSLGYNVSLHPVRDGRENLYAYRDRPVVVFSTHLDVVPPDLPVRETPAILFGRGACDAKGLAAAMIAAAESLAAEGERRIGLLFVVGEEDGSDGAQATGGIEPKGRFLINGEPTENRLVTAQKGALRVTVRAQGKAAHSGYPELGDSAINHLLDALQRIRSLPLPVDPILGESSLNIGRIIGGEASNVIAPYAEAQLMYRLVAPSGELRTAIVAAAGERTEVEFTLEVPILRAPALAGWEEATVGYASDLPFLAAWGTGYQLGPGTIHLAHTDCEQIAIAELLGGVQNYVRLARTLLVENDR